VGLLDGKVCIVTGGAGSIGLASARLLLAEGANVALVDLSEAKLAKAKPELDPDRAMTIQADVTRTDDVRRYIDRTAERWGRVDVFFSNAGNDGPIVPTIEYPEDIFDSIIATHVRGCFLGCKYVIPRMNDGGSIVITSSVVGTTSDPGIAAYATSKHAVIGLMRTVAKEAAPRGIRVNVVAPGPIATDFQRNVETGLSRAIGRDAGQFLDGLIPLGRHGRAEEIGRLVLYLASAQSSFSTGAVFMADGGMSI
jgi:NAD(P)-dependent dehydrogenase (short-subunit alcohol dehydrogenase family)